MKDSSDRNLWLVSEMRRHAELVARQVSKGREVFLDTDDDAVRAAVEHHLELMAEAAGKLSRSFREVNPEVPWERLAGLRVDAAHPYDEGKTGPLAPERLWSFVNEDLPSITRRLARLRPAARRRDP